MHKDSSSMIKGAAMGLAAANRPQADNAPNTVVLLGCQVYHGKPSLMLQGRIEAAYDYLTAHPNAVCITTGGLDRHSEPFTEAGCAARELIAMGIAPERVWIEDQARNTRENVDYSRALIRQRTGENVDKLGIVTSEYHLYRAGLFARQQGVEPVGIPARTSKAYLFVDYFLREILAVWYYTIF